MGLTRNPLGSMGTGLLKTQLRDGCMESQRGENEGRELEAVSPSVECSVKASHESTTPVDRNSWDLPQAPLNTRMASLEGPKKTPACPYTDLPGASRWAVVSLKNTEARWTSQTYCSMAFFFKNRTPPHPHPHPCKLRLLL